MTEPHTPAAASPHAAPMDPPRTTLSPWFSWVARILWFCGVMYGVLGVVAAAALIFLAQSDGDPLLGKGMGLFVFVLCAGFGALNFVAARGLLQQSRWGWVLSVVLGALYAPSICLPFGVVMLIGLLRDDVRKPCLD